MLKPTKNFPFSPTWPSTVKKETAYPSDRQLSLSPFVPFFFHRFPPFFQGHPVDVHLQRGRHHRLLCSAMEGCSHGGVYIRHGRIWKREGGNREGGEGTKRREGEAKSGRAKPQAASHVSGELGRQLSCQSWHFHFYMCLCTSNVPIDHGLHLRRAHITRDVCSTGEQTTRYADLFLAKIESTRSEKSAPPWFVRFHSFGYYYTTNTYERN